MHGLLVGTILCLLLELSHQDRNWDEKLWEGKGISICCQVQSDCLDDLLDNFVASLLCLDVLLGKFERDERVWDGLVLKWFGLRVKEAQVGGVHRVEDVLGCGYELTSLSIDLHNQVEELHVEWEVLHVVRQTSYANNKLNKWVH